MKIFLVEDEVIALRALERKIADLGGDYEVVGTAMNGVQALKLLPAAMPDVVITDIRMPDMDGIELTERIRKEHPGIIPIIATGYQEFEYAKKAISLGVKDYLLKPVEPAELGRCLAGCAELLKKRARRNVVSFLIGSEQVSVEASATGSYTIAYFIIANALSDFENILHPSVPYIPTEEFAAHLSKFCPETLRPVCFDGFFSNEKVVVLRGSTSTEQTQQWLTCAAQALEAHCKEFITVFFAEAQNADRIGSMIRSTRKKALQSMVLGITSVSSHCAPLPPPDEKLKEYASLLSMLLRQNQTDLLRSNIHRIFTAWRNPPRPAMSVQNDMIYLLDSLKQNFAAEKTFAFPSTYLVENLACFSVDWEHFAENFYQLLIELFDFSHNSNRSVPPEELVSRIEAYFQRNLGENITLQMLSDEMGLSKVYLCRVFKRFKDMTPIDYFTRMKIERAQELLRRFPDMPVREVSEQLGFSDMYYFSKVFKKFTGNPPSEARS